MAGFDVLITALEDTVASVTRNWYVTAAALWRENTRGKERYRLLSWQKKKKKVVGLTLDFAKTIIANSWRLIFFFPFAITFGELPNYKI